ncbi:signal transduction histidine kinase [Microlunatus panaciterrae]|uniref:Signal transduction histidine kinase n=1 Tax=Microlunatus panaciterrae TaxID=400768 RepID=A0ABS2RDW7_9ACTN|nr:signal transduction histidine kinase [Microlunatus panaciterrae]
MGSWLTGVAMALADAGAGEREGSTSGAGGRPEGAGAEVAILDREGVIVSVNAAWRQFCGDNDGDPARTGVGMSYLEVCAAAGDDPQVQLVVEAIRSAIGGNLAVPRGLTISCDSPELARRFDMLVSSRMDDEGRCLGAMVTLTLTMADRIVPRTEPAPAASMAPVVSPPPPSAFGAPWDTADEALTLTFPDVPQLELEEVIGQLTARAQDVLAAQGRLRSLLRANAKIVSDLSLPALLRHIVVAARELVQARYAALGVIGPNGKLEQFVHDGMPPELVERIGVLPEGKGILGLLIHSPGPVRLNDLNAHPAAAGFPEHHPRMTSFLGVPIQVRNQTFGNLYLTDSVKGTFSSDDQQLLTALAATAGSAITNARLYLETQQQRHWLSASTALTQQLFAGTTERPLDVVLRYALRGADADSATLVMPVSDHELSVEASAGALAAMSGRVVDSAHTMAAEVIRTGRAQLSSDYAADFAKGQEAIGVGLGAVVGVPLTGPDGQIRGVLSVSRLAGRAPFTQTDKELLSGFAAHAGLALELDRARTEHEFLTMVEDHDRIASDLHDHVIQELFAVGMGLEGMIEGLDESQRGRISGYVKALDDTIRRIRATIYQLHPMPHQPEGLKQRLLFVLDEETTAPGLHSEIQFSGPIEQVPTELADDVVAVVREAITNAARHSRASSMTIALSFLDPVVTLDVTDDGCGIPPSVAHGELFDMRERAERHGGSLDLRRPAQGGTHLRWTAHVPEVQKKSPSDTIGSLLG